MGRNNQTSERQHLIGVAGGGEGCGHVAVVPLGGIHGPLLFLLAIQAVFEAATMGKLEDRH